MESNPLAKFLLITGAVLLLLGGLLLWLPKDFTPGKLPGDLEWKNKNWSVHVPLVSSILLSLVFSLLLYLYNRFIR